MKNIILMVAIVATAFNTMVLAQETSTPNIQNVTSAYIDVKNSLVKDNGVSVRAAAKILYDVINNVPMEKLSAAEHKTWMEYSEKLSYDAEHMKETDDIDHQREHFTKLSINFYKMLKALNNNTTDLYYQYCPMANGGKGAYWVSEQEGILNPYFGKRMLKCGSNKETLVAKQ